MRRSPISINIIPGHSESIITRDYNNALKFQDEIDAAAVYVNASTRFTDGFEFGFGAEIGISTQKLHARGPMGLEGSDHDEIYHFRKRSRSENRSNGRMPLRFVREKAAER